MNIIAVGILFTTLIYQITTGYPKDYTEEVYKWKSVEYENLPKSGENRIVLACEKLVLGSTVFLYFLEYFWIGPYRYYIPENNNIGSFGYHPASGLMIVNIVRLRPGVPTSVGAFCVSDYKVGSSPKIWGFPNYQINTLRAEDFSAGSDEDADIRVWNKPGGYLRNHYRTSVDLQRIIGVFHITIDEKCNRVFFMDNGQVQYYHNATYVIQKPALMVIDLPSNGCETRNFPIIKRSELPDKIIAKGSNGFMHVFLDYESYNSCEDLFLYITNTFYNYLVVYDYKKDEFWTFEHETFLPVISESYFLFDKTFQYQMEMGMFSISLGYPDENGDQIAYYTLVASTDQYAVSTKVLKNRRKSPANFNPDDFRIMGYRGCDHQSLRTVIDYTYGVMFYSEIQSNQIRCWNINQPLNPDYIDVVYESDEFLFGAQMFIDSQGYLWFQSTHIPVLYDSDFPLNLRQVNNRIFRMKVSDAIRGTICEDGNKL